MAQAAEVSFNPFEPGFNEDPYPQYQALREHQPVYQSPFGTWVLTAHDDAVRFLRDPALSVEDRNAHDTPMDEMIRSVVGEERMEYGSRSMLSRDPPDHTRLRKLVSKAFTPRTIEGLRPRIQTLVDEALAPAAEWGTMDLVTELAFPVPFAVICEMLGMPETNRSDVREWSHLIVRSLEPLVDPDLVLAIVDAGDKMRAMVSEVIAWKRREPADDMLSALIAAEEHGDVLSDDELLEQVMLLFIAGHETTVNLIGNGTLALLRNRAQLERMRDDPTLDVNAIEELLRYDSPVQMSRRITLQEVEIGGRTMEKGAFVAVVLASANRDRSFWGPSADDLDLGREEAHNHLSFGGGHHYCLGAALARLEGRVAIGTLIRRFPKLEQAGDPEYNGRINLRGLKSLPLTL